MSNDHLRSQFPALGSGFVFLENAGGSQVPSCVADAMHRYMTSTYVQLGASYDISQRSTQTVDDAHAFVNRFMNGEGIGQVVLGPSSTQLVTMLAECYSRKLRPGDQVVICETAHEANAGPWEKLERFGIVLKTWKVDPISCQCSLEDLRALMTDRTRLVAFPHVSNLLGEIVDVAAITQLVHEYGARVVVDGVAYAPHRAIDVKAWDVDWYFYSTYKVFGPHMGALFGKTEAFAEIEGPNHFFLPVDAYKFELGGANHEGCAGLVALQDYLALVADAPRTGMIERSTVEAAWEKMERLEIPLHQRLCEYLEGCQKVKLVGPRANGPERVGTVSFTHSTLRPTQIVPEVDKAGIGIRWGHMYAYRLCKALGVDTNEGVVRVSMVHYNAPGEIEQLIHVLDEIL